MPALRRLCHPSPRLWQAGWRVGAAVLLCLAGLAASVPARAAASTAPVPEGFTQHLAERINEYRRAHGLAPLSWSDELAALAAEHSQDMAARRRLSHEGFRERRQRSASRICVENVAHNFPTAETLLDGWRRSPGHQRNLVEPKVERMGLAATARYVTFFACR
jgi:uncharacterized protein YkwD